MTCVSVRRPCCVRGDSCVAGRRRNPAMCFRASTVLRKGKLLRGRSSPESCVCVCRCIRASTVLRKGKLLRRCVCAYCVYIYIYYMYMHIYIYLFIYLFMRFRQNLRWLSLYWSVHRMVAVAWNLFKREETHKKRCFFFCACLRLLVCGHNVCLGRVVLSRLDPLHHEWVCPCGGLTLHDFTIL